MPCNAIWLWMLQGYIPLQVATTDSVVSLRNWLPYRPGCLISTRQLSVLPSGLSVTYLLIQVLLTPNPSSNTNSSMWDKQTLCRSAVCVRKNLYSIPCVMTVYYSNLQASYPLNFTINPLQRSPDSTVGNAYVTGRRTDEWRFDSR